MPFPDRSEAIRKFEVPHTRTGILRFLGMVRYYQRFVPQLARLAQPRTKLLRKESDPKGDWGKEQNEAIGLIKDVFLSPDCLTHFAPSLPIILHTDASDFALGAVLSHFVEQNGIIVERPICYASKTLDRAQANYGVTEKECLAVVWATELFRTMLLGTEFVLETDHSALKQLLKDKTSTGRLARWALKLQEFDMVVRHRKGDLQGNADFMSRMRKQEDGSYLICLIKGQEALDIDQHHEYGHLTRVTMRMCSTSLGGDSSMLPIHHVRLRQEMPSTNAEFFSRLKGAQAEDPWIQNVRASMSGESTGGEQIAKWVDANCIIDIDGFLVRSTLKATAANMRVRRVNTVLVPASMRKEVISLVHHHPVHGHRGYLTTYRTIWASYFWIGMQQDIRDFVAACEKCQQRRAVRNPVPHRARPLPDESFQVVSLDFAGPFSKNAPGMRYPYCLCIVDQLTRFPIFVPIPNIKTSTVIRHLEEQLYSTFGMPMMIILDQAGSLDGKEMRKHLADRHILVDIVSPDNHRANGMAERFIQELNKGMSMHREDWKKWHMHAKNIELSIRTSPSIDTGISPAEMLYGRKMRTSFGGLLELYDEDDNEVLRRSDRLAGRSDLLINDRARRIASLQEGEDPDRPYGLRRRTFTVGEIVLVFTPRDKDDGSGGIPRRWKAKWGY